MNKKHWAAGIVHHNHEYLILTKNHLTYQLPKVNINLGLDAIFEVKQEIEKEYLIKIRFERSLPLAWSELIQLHTGSLQQFTSYIIFNSADFSPRDQFWVKISDLDNIDIVEHDREALAYFLEN